MLIDYDVITADGDNGDAAHTATDTHTRANTRKSKSKAKVTSE